MQQTAWLLTLLLVLALAAVFGWVARRAPSAAPSAPPSGLRGALLAAALLAFVPITAFSLSHVPYGADTRGALVVDAVGHQWRWDLSRTRLPVGRPVVFRVTSADVNHGFAVYDPELRIVAQTQAMPGYENLLGVTFDRAGTYQVLCLEYCGLVHHGMRAVLEVAEEGR